MLSPGNLIKLQMKKYVVGVTIQALQEDNLPMGQPGQRIGVTIGQL